MRRTRKPIMAVAAFAIALIMALSGCTPAIVGRSYFPINQRSNADCIIHHESRGDPGAVSPTNDHGLFQINAVHAADFKRVTGKPFYNGVYDAHANSKYARWLWDHQGWKPWSSRRACGL